MPRKPPDAAKRRRRGKAGEGGGAGAAGAATTTAQNDEPLIIAVCEGRGRDVGLAVLDLKDATRLMLSQESNSHTYKRIAKVDLRFPPFVSELAKDFISRLLKHDPASRMKLDDAKTHPWITTHADAK